MPLYEYQCTKCGSVVERMYSMDEKPAWFHEECTSCGELCEHTAKLAAPNIVSGVSGRMGVPSDFKNRLEQIKQHYPNMKSSLV